MYAIKIFTENSSRYLFTPGKQTPRLFETRIEAERWIPVNYLRRIIVRWEIVEVEVKEKQ